MSAVADSRRRVLDRIRSATRNSAATEEQAHAAPQRNYVQRGEMGVRARRERFIERLREYDAEVVECTAEELPGAIAAVVEASGKRRFVVPPEIPKAWLTDKIAGLEWKIDHSLSAEEIEQAEGVMTAAFCGVADSGTIVLHHSAAEGRRVLTLLPDWHLCIVRTSQVVETLPEYFSRCERPPALVTWISGPSATADIEMTRIKGVHGPRFLNVILVNDVGQANAAQEVANMN